MKLRKVFAVAAAAVVGACVYQNRSMLKAALKLEKVQGDLFTRLDNTGSKDVYLCKNDTQSVEVFKDWIAYNGWQEANNVGESFFFINDAGETLTLERKATCCGRYITWTASGSIE